MSDIQSTMTKWGMKPVDLNATRAVLLIHHIEDYETYKGQGREDAAQASIDDIIEVLDEIDWNIGEIEDAFENSDVFWIFVRKLERIPGIGKVQEI